MTCLRCGISDGEADLCGFDAVIDLWRIFPAKACNLKTQLQDCSEASLDFLLVLDVPSVCFYFDLNLHCLFFLFLFPFCFYFCFTKKKKIKKDLWNVCCFWALSAARFVAERLWPKAVRFWVFRCCLSEAAMQIQLCGQTKSKYCRFSLCFQGWAEWETIKIICGKHAVF